MTSQGHQHTSSLSRQVLQNALKTLLLAALIRGADRVNGQRESFTCREEGYHPDPSNCQIYYRCVAWGDGSPLSKFQFECGPGTVFSHSNGDICVHPRDSERDECNESGNDLDSNANDHSQPSNWATHQPGHPTDPSNSWPDQGPQYPSPEDNDVNQPSAASGPSTSNHIPKPTPSAPASASDHVSCEHEGFLGQPQDCRKFVRCVDEGMGALMRYEFTCGEGTVWDPLIEACNHAWAVRRSDCQAGIDSSTLASHNEHGPHEVHDHNHNTLPQQPPCQTEKPQASYPAYPSPSAGGSATSYPPSVADGMSPSAVYLPSSQSTLSTLAVSTKPTPPSFTSSPSDNHREEGKPPGSGGSGAFSCTEEGFFADPNSCTKFYRCAEGDKALEKFEFECGEGTAWDQALQTCNHAYAVPGCGQVDGDSNQTPSEPQEDSKTTESSPQSSSTEQSSVTDSSTEPEVSSTDSSSSQAPTEQSTAAASSTTSSTASPEESSEDSATPEATKEPSTSEEPSMSSSSATMEPSPASVANSPPTTMPGNSAMGTTSEPSSTTTKPSHSGSSGSQCQDEGFFADPEDCRKFYRCVSGNSGYSQFKFDCAPGTAWDQSLLTCNYIDQVASCGSEANEIPSGPGEGEKTSAEPESSSVPTTPTKRVDQGTSEPTTAMSPTAGSDAPDKSSESTGATSSPGSSTTAVPIKGNCSTPTSDNGIVCNEAGFFGNPSQCDKFYRCVDNGNGFNVYHFDCPPGTIFDPSISVCNYPESVYPARSCPSSGPSTSEPPTSSESSETTEESSAEPSSMTEKGEEPTTESSAEASTEPTESMTEVPEAGTETPGPQEGTTAAETTTGPEEMTTPGSETTQESTESAEASTEAATTGNPSESTSPPDSTTPEGAMEPSMVTPCPIGNLTDEQIVLVCPTGFKRHPKYCNMFYQCSNEDEMKIRILVLGCPEGTIFDEENIKCSPESESSRACDSEMATARFYRQLESTSVSPIRVSRDSLCPGEGHYPYQQGCNNAFYKCRRDSRSHLQGYLYKCPKDFVYWSVSRRCERASRLPACSQESYEDNERLNSWESQWELPVEDNNLSARSLRF